MGELLDDLCSARPMVRAIVPGGWMTQDHTSKVYLDMLTEVYFASNSALHPDDLKLVPSLSVLCQVASLTRMKLTSTSLTCWLRCTSPATMPFSRRTWSSSRSNPK